MGSFRKYFAPVIKELVKEVEAYGMKRAMAATTVVLKYVSAQIADGDLTKEEAHAIGKITKSEAHGMAQDILHTGTELSRGAVNGLITGGVKLLQDKGVDVHELAFGVEDPEDDTDIA